MTYILKVKKLPAQFAEYIMIWSLLRNRKVSHGFDSLLRRGLRPDAVVTVSWNLKTYFIGKVKKWRSCVTVLKKPSQLLALNHTKQQC